MLCTADFDKNYGFCERIAGKRKVSCVLLLQCFYLQKKNLPNSYLPMRLHTSLPIEERKAQSPIVQAKRKEPLQAYFPNKSIA